MGISMVNELFSYKRMTANGQVFTGPGGVGGLTCATGGSIKVYDGTDNTGAVVLNTTTLISGQYVPIPCMVTLGCYVEITTADVTFFVAR